MNVENQFLYAELVLSPDQFSYSVAEYLSFHRTVGVFPRFVDPAYSAARREHISLVFHQMPLNPREMRATQRVVTLKGLITAFREWVFLRPADFGVCRAKFASFAVPYPKCMQKHSQN
jgi:hypothetical protein